jgi:hypothetical protein
MWTCGILLNPTQSPMPSLSDVTCSTAPFDAQTTGKNNILAIKDYWDFKWFIVEFITIA